METYPVDIDPTQLVRWLKAESEAAPSAFRINATRRRELRAIPLRKEAHFGDVEREDLTEVATIARLDIAPFHASDGWLLSVVVEDELAPRITDARADDEQRIDLGTFYQEYIRRGRGNAEVFIEVADAAARSRVNRLLAEVETDRHPTLPGKQRG